jgi:2-keto-4-pentenoate hydratase/2-oxohepta-3-ene-1,7-dioic acid hydratase in catechol pathway
MRITRFLDGEGRCRVGRDLGDGEASILEGEVPWAAEPTGEIVRIERRLAPVEPRAILCVGLNYKDHARETGQPLPQRPVLFMKNPAALNHPDAPILIPRALVERPEVDYEVELAVVIGRDLRHADAASALDAVAGYTIANDVSARRMQKRAGQWVRGKSLDTFCPLGPVLVTPDEIPDPQALELSTRLNGELLQRSTTGEMIFTVAELLADLSREMTLLAGTVILTGTPAGVGFVREPPVFLMPGDSLELTIEPIGSLRNPVLMAPEPAVGVHV